MQKEKILLAYSFANFTERPFFYCLPEFAMFVIYLNTMNTGEWRKDENVKASRQDEAEKTKFITNKTNF